MSHETFVEHQKRPFFVQSIYARLFTSVQDNIIGMFWFSGDKNEEKEKVMKQEFGQTCDWIKKRLGDKVASVQISNRLSSSPCVLVSGKFGWSANMER